MPETVSKGLEIPATGSLPGTWGEVAINPDMVAIDGMLGGFATIALTNSNVTLTKPSGFTATPGAGPTQSQNAMLTLTGTLSANVTITFPLPGFYLVENLCVMGAFYIRLGSATPGKYICAIPGETIQIFNDGVDMRYVGLGRVGTYMDIATGSIPTWITNCTVAPYLYCNGATFSAGTYPQLAAYLGGTTLPDSRGRTRYTLDASTGRTTAVFAFGNTLTAGGGDQWSQYHNHAAGDYGHQHTYTRASTGGTNFQQNTTPAYMTEYTDATSYGYANIYVGYYGNGNSQNLPPLYVGGLTFIRAG